MFCIYLRRNSDLCHLQHKLIGFYSGDEKCLQRGTDGSLNKAVCASSVKVKTLSGDVPRPSAQHNVTDNKPRSPAVTSVLQHRSPTLPSAYTWVFQEFANPIIALRQKKYNA